MSKNILIIAITNLSRSPRPLCQLKALRHKFNVDTMGLKKSGLENNFYKIKKKSLIVRILKLPLLLFRMYNFYYWDKNKKNVIDQMRGLDYDLIIVHEVRMLPLAFKISKNAKIILDAHEYSPCNFDDKLIWKIFIKPFYNYLCHKFLSKCDRVITVCDSIAKLYKKNFNINCHIVTNATDYSDLKPYQSKGDKIRIIHHGNASSSRKLELMIDMMGQLDQRFELYLMLVAKRMNRLYLKKLKRRAKKYSNVYFLEPVPYNKIIEYSNQFDIGLIFYPPSNINLEYCLPNKLFEFIQSRLCIVSAPLIEIEKYVLKYNLGIVSKSFSVRDLAKKMNKLSNDEINKYKENSHYNAQLLSSDLNRSKILKIIEGLI